MAHCTCKAGLGEVCSHAAALMYSVVAAVDMRNGQACTQKPCSWTQPSEVSVRGVPYEELRNISFSHKETRLVPAPGPDIRPSEDECQRFFEMLHDSEKHESKPKRSAILSVTEGHSHRYIPKVMQLDLPLPLSNLYSSSRLEMDLSSLLVESAKVFDSLQLTQQQMGSGERGEGKGKLCCHDAGSPQRPPSKGFRVHYQPRTSLDWSIT
ncbi:uncharacterized protein LOC141795161 [Halichoeres trimaculatus]